MIYILIYKLISDGSTHVVKAYTDEAKAVKDMELMKSLANDKRFKIFTAELEKSGPVRKPRCINEVSEYSAEFEQFWARYPWKSAKGKAWDCWRRIKPPLQDVLKALEWQVLSQQWTQDGGKWVPMPTTYLNQAKWHDEPRDVVMTPTGKPWFIVGSAIEEKGKELGLTQTRDEVSFQFYDRVRREAGITQDQVKKAKAESMVH
jgi:hypothetical protein